MQRRTVPGVPLLVAVSLAIAPGCATHPNDHLAEGVGAAIVLDQLHRAAAEADEDVYFSLFTGDAIFLGTDPDERWTIEEFKAFAMPYFTERDSAWVYECESRNISVAPGGWVAWFDERLMNASYGECRGTGVMIPTDEGWKIAQYSLSIPIPNDLALPVVNMVREYEE